METNIQRQIKPSRESDLGNEVQKLLRKGGTISQHDLNVLKNKYGNDELVSKIEKAYFEKFNKISKRARKFAKLIRIKYADKKHPFHFLLEKAYKYKQKYNLTDAEFTEFQRQYETTLIGLKSPEVLEPNTNISNLLGNVNVNLHTFASKLNESDYKILQEIIKLHATSRPLHSQVILQSMQYEDCGIEAITGKYDRNIHNVVNHVHPVIAALFLPKIDVVETHFLHSNIANIVKTRYNNEPFTSVADYELYFAIAKDPNDIVCDSRSTINDLYNRAQLQNQLWNAVLALRNGQYYNNSFHQFISSVDVCKVNKYDNPDLIYGRNDGTILKRLLAAFSFRPTLVSTTPFYPSFNTNPYQQNVIPIVTNVPMINLRLPSGTVQTPTLNLKDAIEQQQVFIENGNIISKNTSLIYSRGILIFFVDRRANTIRVTENITPYAMTRLPISIGGFERLNDTPVDFNFEIKIRDDNYKLRSVVLSEINKMPDKFDKKLIVGSSTAIMIHRDIAAGSMENETFLYDPYCVTHPSFYNDAIQTNAPIQTIRSGPTLNDDECSFLEISRKRGIIFIYQLQENKNGNDHRPY